MVAFPTHHVSKPSTVMCPKCEKLLKVGTSFISFFNLKKPLVVQGIEIPSGTNHTVIVRCVDCLNWVQVNTSNLIEFREFVLQRAWYRTIFTNFRNDPI